MLILKELDPRLKLTWCLFLVFTALVSRSMILNAVLLGLILISELLSEKSLKSFKMLSILLLILSTQVLIINLIFGREGDLLYSWGILQIFSGFIATAMLAFLRIGIISLSAYQFGVHTDPMDMAQMLIYWHIPYRYAMLVPMVARFFPVMIGEYQSICDSQSARGVPCDTVVEKIRNLPASILPLMYRAMRISSDAALSVELRGYGRHPSRNFQKKINLRPLEGMTIVCLIIGFGGVLVKTIL
jgi:energy-coupling factor transport system permease protein